MIKSSLGPATALVLPYYYYYYYYYYYCWDIILTNSEVRRFLGLQLKLPGWYNELTIFIARFSPVPFM
jgi:hypothetical protein